MKRLNCMLLIAIVLTMLFSCSGETPYELMHDSSEIKSIQIVKNLSYDTDSKDWVYESICEVEDIDLLAAELTAMKCSRSYDDPPSIITESFVIIIDYENGDREFVAKHAARVQRSDGRHGESSVTFEGDRFNALIEKYIEMAE